jgi:hypothetical protein
MVTKTELENDCKENITRLTKELNALEAQHGRFSAEDNADKEREKRYEELAHQLGKLEEKAYIGNFGNNDNWYHNRIPKTLGFSKKQISEDSGLITEALNELKKNNLEEIEHSEEYLALKKQIEECAFSKFSKEHRKLHNDISKAKDDIDWWQSRSRRLDNKGDFIQMCKYVAEQKRREETQKLHDAKVAKYKTMIIKRGK